MIADVTGRGSAPGTAISSRFARVIPVKGYMRYIELLRLLHVRPADYFYISKVVTRDIRPLHSDMQRAFFQVYR
jgi:hypothetical protein